MSIEGPPPLKPPKTYCDVTGYEVFLLKIEYFISFLKKDKI